MKNCVKNIVIGLSFFLFACDISDNDIEPGISFSKIFNNPVFSGSYDPLGIVQTSDSGYLALSASDNWNIYLLKANHDGEYSWDLELPAPYVNPLPGIHKIDNDFYFFCMDEITLGTYLMKINLNGNNPEVVQSYPEIIYPLSAALTPGNGMIIQSYNRDSRKTMLSKLNAGQTIEWSAEYPVLEDVEERIIKHLARLGSRIPFFTGYVEGAGNQGYYYLNGFYNFTVSMLFINVSDGETIGVINGFRDQSGISSAIHLTDHTFAVSRYDFGDNFLLPEVEVDLNGISFSGDWEVNGFPELSSNSKVIVKKVQVNGRDIILYASDTKSKQIVIYAYDEDNGELLGINYFGQTYPYEIGEFAQTSDEGLIILGKTYVAGRFPRLSLFKLTKEEVSSLIQ